MGTNYKKAGARMSLFEKIGIFRHVVKGDFLDDSVSKSEFLGVHLVR